MTRRGQFIWPGNRLQPVRSRETENQNESVSKRTALGTGVLSDGGAGGDKLVKKAMGMAKYCRFITDLT